ncbi:MAG: branched-chain amino acid aminotransferase [Ferruginibacter sp.]
MIAASDFNITRVQQSKLKDFDMGNIAFGKYFTDHMLEVDYENGEWKTPEIKPYQPLLLDPSTAALHYGQAIFEGIKAYKDAEGNAFIFRPHDNYLRFNQSAARMMMPAVPEEIFMEGMRTLINIDKNWIPQKTDHSLYIRPFMFATDHMLGVKPSETYKFMVLLSPAGPYYSSPIRIYVEETYTRAAQGGVGFAKNAGNYGASLLPTEIAKTKGYDQILWTDAFEHKYVQEVGTMNVMFIIGDVAVTPRLDEGTILAGVTRDSVIILLKEMGIKVEERLLSVDELIEAHKKGILKEAFGTGTAATISPIKELRYKDYTMTFDVDSWKTAPALKHKLDAIRNSKEPDTHGWMFKI